MAASATGRSLAVTVWEHENAGPSVRLWSVASGKELGRLASRGEDGTVLVWDATDRKP
jgi:hypothetical protein